MKNAKKEKCAELGEIVAFMDSCLRVGEFKDYDGAKNGLQCANSGKVRSIASAVDAGLGEIKLAAHMGADLLVAADCSAYAYNGCKTKYSRYNSKDN